MSAPARSAAVVSVPRPGDRAGWAAETLHRLALAQQAAKAFELADDTQTGHLVDELTNLHSELTEHTAEMRAL